MSEEYSNGYARGYEAGQESMLKLAKQDIPDLMREALAEQPAQQCKHCNGSGIGFDGIGSKCICQYGREPEQPAQQEPVAWSEFVETACALIKAADDAAADDAADGDYMLDSDDCIKVLRGEWKGPMAHDHPTRPQAREPLTDEQVAYILGQLPKPPTNDGSALHDWAMQAVHALAAHGITGDT